MIKTIIADDHAIVRQGIALLIKEESDISVPDEASDGSELLEKIQKKEYDVVILDITLPGKNGLEILKQIKMEKPNIPVLILSMHPEEEFGIRMLRSGAAGYITKHRTGSELIKAIREVYNGNKYITYSLAQKLADNLEMGKNKPLHELLTDLEFEVLRMIATGKTVSQIANKLNLSVKTVSVHRTHILEKMQLENNAQLMHYMAKNLFPL